MAYRGNEVKNGSQAYPVAGTVRGDPKSKDWYYFSGIRISVGINNSNHKSIDRKGVIDCPKRVI